MESNKPLVIKGKHYEVLSRSWHSLRLKYADKYYTLHQFHNGPWELIGSAGTIDTFEEDELPQAAERLL